jgi:hypothetical protein
MREIEEGRRDAAAAGMLMFHGAACAGGGRWGVLLVAALLAWSLLKGHRATRATVFGISGLIGTGLALGLARYAFRVSGLMGAARPPADAVWVAYFTCFAVYCLALAALLAPRAAFLRFSPPEKMA